MDFKIIIEFIEKAGYINASLVAGIMFILVIALIYFIAYLESNSQHSSLRELTLYRQYQVVAMSQGDKTIQTHVVRAFGRVNAFEKVVAQFYKTNYTNITFRVTPLHEKKPLNVSE